MAKRKQTDSFKALSEEKELAKIGVRIRELRKAAGYNSYEKFANEHDINRAQWGKYENGANITAATLIRICNILKISLRDFFSVGFD